MSEEEKIQKGNRVEPTDTKKRRKLRDLRKTIRSYELEMFTRFR
ncbi:MAG: hypothetical protein ACFFCZ_11025 [Promethearchaeota archaeon]